MAWEYLLIAVVAVGMLAMLTELMIIGAVIALGFQAVGWLQSGVWTPYHLASQLNIAPDALLTHWVMIDRAIHYVVFDAETAVVVLAVGVVVAPIKGWLEDNSAPVAPKAASKDAAPRT
jgi:hypothetical protein